MRKCLLLFACVLAFNANAACEDKIESRVDARLTIDLQKQLIDGMFYYRSDHYAIVMEPAPLIRELTKLAEFGPLHAERLLRDIRSTPAGGEAKDLFALVLKDALYHMTVERVVANLLEHGEASIIDAWALPSEDRRYVSSLVLLKLSGSSSYLGRRFCTPSGDLILEVTDQIA